MAVKAEGLQGADIIPVQFHSNTKQENQIYVDFFKEYLPGFDGEDCIFQMQVYHLILIYVCLQMIPKF